jgi:hypoxanthine phosphoribosyltransferase
MSKIIKYKKKDFDKDIETLVRKIKKSKITFSYIVALSRGGLIPGVVLSHKLGLSLVPVNWSTRDRDDSESNCWIPEDIINGKKILVVDDIIDSGETLRTMFAEWNPPQAARNKLITENIYVASLIFNKDQTTVPNFYGTKISRKKTPEWFEFWWEAK